MDLAGVTIDCGVNALSNALTQLDIVVPKEELSRKLHVGGQSGTTFAEISQVAQELGPVVANGAHLDPEELLGQRPPCIAFVKGDHFVTISAIDRSNRELLILDEPRAPQWVRLDDFRRDWQGEILILRRNDEIVVPAKLWIPDFSINLGTHIGMSGQRVDSTLMNIGDRPLTINRVRFSCDCVKADISTLTIAPHDAERIALTVDTHKKAEGPFALTMILETDDRNTERLALQGTVRRGVRAIPNFFPIGEVASTDVKRVLTTRVFVGKGVDIAPHPVYLDDGVEWVSSQVIQDDEYEVKISFDPSAAQSDGDGRFRKVAVIRSSQEQPEVGLVIVGRWRPNVSVSPGRWFLGKVKPEQELKIQAQVFGTNDNNEIQIYEGVGASGKLVKQYKWDAPCITLQLITPTELGVFERNFSLAVGDQVVPLSVVGIVDTEASQVSKLGSEGMADLFQVGAQ